MSLGTPDISRPHYRRTRVNGPRPPRRRRPWIIVIGVGLGVLASVAALAVGTFVIGTFGSVPPQGSAGGMPNAPPGVSFPSAGATFVNATTTPAAGNCSVSNLGSLASPTALSNGNGTAICLSTNATGYATGDLVYTLVVSWNSTAANSTIFKVQVSLGVTPTGHDISDVTVYVKTSSRISTSEQAVLAVDLTQAGDTSVDWFDALVTQL